MERRQYNYKDEEKSLGRLVTATHGVDRSWAARGTCFDYEAARDDSGWTWWMANTLETTRGRPARERLEDEKARMALIICAGCPVQYDCAAYGTQTEQQACIWGVSSKNREWLQSRAAGGIAGGLAVIAAGRDSGLPVDQWVTIQRRDAVAV